jgi:hypothetical protein
VLVGSAVAILRAVVQATPFEGYYLLLLIQLGCALGLMALIAFCTSAVASGLRELRRIWRSREEPRQWRWFSIEGAAVGAVATALWLTAAPRDTYLGPSGRERLEFRLPSLIEGPLGLHPCSDVFVPVTVTYTDVAGVRIVKRATESKEPAAAVRRLHRQIRWHDDGTVGVVVILPETGLRLSFPRPHADPAGGHTDESGYRCGRVCLRPDRYRAAVAELRRQPHTTQGLVLADGHEVAQFGLGLSGGLGLEGKPRRP